MVSRDCLQPITQVKMFVCRTLLYLRWLLWFPAPSEIFLLLHEQWRGKNPKEKSKNTDKKPEPLQQMFSIKSWHCLGLTLRTFNVISSHLYRFLSGSKFHRFLVGSNSGVLICSVSFWRCQEIRHGWIREYNMRLATFSSTLHKRLS